MIKYRPEDFIVEEETDIEEKANGKVSYFILEKRNMNTEDAVNKAAKILNKKRKEINHCGNKDKIAVTRQYISVPDLAKDKRKDFNEDIKLEYICQGDERLNLGSHKGNWFTINVYTDERPKRLEYVPNLFGKQRFSHNNHLIGKAIVKGEMKKATELILENRGNYEKEVEEHLEKAPNDYVGAIRKIPKKILTLFIHAYQGHIFNKAARRVNDNVRIPLVGFGTDKKNRYIKDILEGENIEPRDFIIRQIPEISSEGDERQSLLRVKELEIQEKEDNHTVRFFLDKGSYATVVLSYLFDKDF